MGRLLVNCALEALHREGIRKATLVAFAENEMGNGVWKTMGFHAREDLVYRDSWIDC